VHRILPALVFTPSQRADERRGETPSNCQGSAKSAGPGKLGGLGGAGDAEDGLFAFVMVRT